MKAINLLLIEDNEGDIFLIQEAFEEAKILNETMVIRDGEKAIAYFNESLVPKIKPLPDLILLDINLPKIGGHEVLRFIKSHNFLKTLPVIILTSSSTSKDVLKAYEQFANCYITKPIEVSDFSTVISQIEKFWFQLVKLPSGFQA